jgi:hypothetical protein
VPCTDWLVEILSLHGERRHVLPSSSLIATVRPTVLWVDIVDALSLAKG